MKKKYIKKSFSLKYKFIENSSSRIEPLSDFEQEGKAPLKNVLTYPKTLLITLSQKTNH